jgi:hypothetical protein
LKEKKMKQLISALVITLALLPELSHASMRVFNNSGTQLGTFTDLKLSSGLSVAQVSGKAQVSLSAAGFNLTQTSVSGDLTTSECGQSMTADDSELYNLPAITSSVLGCRYTFIHGVSAAVTKRLTINPNNADKILVLANSAGDSITTDTIGHSVVLEAIPAGWAPVGKEQGTFTDSN